LSVQITVVAPREAAIQMARGRIEEAMRYRKTSSCAG
jgi:hypothetical protein